MFAFQKPSLYCGYDLYRDRLAPFRAMLQHVLGKNEYNNTHFHLILVRVIKDILYFDELSHSNVIPFKLDIALSREVEDGNYHKGYVHSVYLNTYNSENTDALFMLCVDGKPW